MSITISNPGCDALVIDTTYTTNPAIFILGSKSFPITLAPGKSTQLTISFNPHLAGDYLETLILETNVGSRNITLRGTGRAKAADAVPQVSHDDIRIYPNPANNFLNIRWGNEAGSLPRYFIIRDLLGREILRLQRGEENIFTCDLHGLPGGLYVLDFGGGEFQQVVIRH
jgi:hypothetical protein